MKTDFETFDKYLKKLHLFFDEQKKLKDVLEVLAPGSVCEHGNQLIDDYIALMEDTFSIPYNLLSWFIFDNNWGKNGYECRIDYVTYKINSSKDMFNYIQKLNEKQD